LRIYFSIQILTFMKICSENEKNFKFKYIRSFGVAHFTNIYTNLNINKVTYFGFLRETQIIKKKRIKKFLNGKLFFQSCINGNHIKWKANKLY